MIYDAGLQHKRNSIPINMMTENASSTELHCKFGQSKARFYRRDYNLRITYPKRAIVLHINGVKNCFGPHPQTRRGSGWRELSNVFQIKHVLIEGHGVILGISLYSQFLVLPPLCRCNFRLNNYFKAAMAGWVGYLRQGLSKLLIF